jgi:hypothetical protein
MRKLVAFLTLLLGTVVWLASPAAAACHSFTVKASPASTVEGGKVTVTVSRDGALADSQVRLTTVDGTARAGSDFTAVDQLVAFTGVTVSKDIELSTTDDTDMEPAETFKLHLSDPAGCPVNTNYKLGDDVTVTIQASDQAVAPAPTATSTTSKPIAGATTSTAPGTVTVGTAPSSTTSTTSSSTTTTASTASTSSKSTTTNDDGDGVGGGVLVAGAIILAALGAGGYALYRRRGL